MNRFIKGLTGVIVTLIVLSSVARPTLIQARNSVFSDSDREVNIAPFNGFTTTRLVVRSNGTNIRSASNSQTFTRIVRVANAGHVLGYMRTIRGNDGHTWYRVAINPGHSNITQGYIRSDLVRRDGTIMIGLSEPILNVDR